MKLLFFIGSMAGGGAERVISILANHYCSKGFDVEIALLLKNEVGYNLDSRIKIVDLTGKYSSYIKNFPSWIRRIRNHIKNSKPDRIVSFIGRINALVLLSTFGIKVPTIVSERNDPKHDGRGRFMLSVCNMCYGLKRCKAIVHQTKYEESCFDSKLESKSYVIPNPVEVTAERTWVDDYRIVTAGRLSEQKNHAMLINAVKEIKSNFPEVKVEIFGDGNLKEKLQSQIDMLELSDTVTLRGNVSDLHKRISSAEAFVMTSNFEGLSNALIEAMMLGMPCISTDYPGADEVITDGEDGIIIPRGDSRKLAEVLKLLFENKALRDDLSKRALKSSEKYKKEMVLNLWDNVIES